MVVVVSVLMAGAACGTPRSTAGSTYAVETSYMAGDEFCAASHVVEIGDDRWFDNSLRSARAPRLDPERTYEGELYVVWVGPPGSSGQARFTTGSTTAEFARFRPCW